MKDNEEIRELFKLYLEGKSNRQQEEALLRYLGGSKNDNKQFAELIEKAWAEESSLREDSSEVDQEFEDILAASERRKRKKTHRFKVWKYAASIVVVCSAALGWYTYQKNQVKPQVVFEMLSRTTVSGEKLKITLPDSTVVYLGGASKLTWPSRFVKAHYRNVHLEGEGFFQVKRDTLSPFIVHSGSMQTRVLGTSFNITAYPSDNIFSVSVRTGKVRVSENTKGILRNLSLLTLGMKLDFHKYDHQYVVNTTKEEDINSWTENRFIFKDADLTTLLNKLERYYKVRFVLKSACLPNNHRFNATFNGKNINDVMEQIRMMSGKQIHYKISKDTLITIWGEGCK